MDRQLERAGRSGAADLKRPDHEPADDLAGHVRDHQHADAEPHADAAAARPAGREDERERMVARCSAARRCGAEPDDRALRPDPQPAGTRRNPRGSVSGPAEPWPAAQVEPVGGQGDIDQFGAAWGGDAHGRLARTLRMTRAGEAVSAGTAAVAWSATAAENRAATVTVRSP